MATSGAASPAGLEVVVSDSGIALSSTTALPGPVTFVFRNESSLACRLKLTGPDVAFEQPELLPLSAAAVTLSLAAGHYALAVFPEGDPERAWKATITVPP